MEAVDELKSQGQRQSQNQAHNLKSASGCCEMFHKKIIAAQRGFIVTMMLRLSDDPRGSLRHSADGQKHSLDFESVPKMNENSSFAVSPWLCVFFTVTSHGAP